MQMVQKLLHMRYVKEGRLCQVAFAPLCIQCITIYNCIEFFAVKTLKDVSGTIVT